MNSTLFIAFLTLLMTASISMRPTSPVVDQVQDIDKLSHPLSPLQEDTVITAEQWEKLKKQADELPEGDLKRSLNKCMWFISYALRQYQHNNNESSVSSSIPSYIDRKREPMTDLNLYRVTLSSHNIDTYDPLKSSPVSNINQKSNETNRLSSTTKIYSHEETSNSYDLNTSFNTTNQTLKYQDFGYDSMESLSSQPTNIRENILRPNYTDRYDDQHIVSPGHKDKEITESSKEYNKLTENDNSKSNSSTKESYEDNDNEPRSISGELFEKPSVNISSQNAREVGHVSPINNIFNEELNAALINPAHRQNVSLYSSTRSLSMGPNEELLTIGIQREVTEPQMKRTDDAHEDINQIFNMGKSLFDQFSDIKETFSNVKIASSESQMNDTVNLSTEVYQPISGINNTKIHNLRVTIKPDDKPFHQNEISREENLSSFNWHIKEESVPTDNETSSYSIINDTYHKFQPMQTSSLYIGDDLIDNQLVPRTESTLGSRVQERNNEDNITSIKEASEYEHNKKINLVVNESDYMTDKPEIKSQEENTFNYNENFNPNVNDNVLNNEDTYITRMPEEMNNKNVDIVNREQDNFITDKSDFPNNDNKVDQYSFFTSTSETNYKANKPIENISTTVINEIISNNYEFLSENLQAGNETYVNEEHKFNKTAPSNIQTEMNVSKKIEENNTDLLKEIKSHDNIEDSFSDDNEVTPFENDAMNEVGSDLTTQAESNLKEKNTSSEAEMKYDISGNIEPLLFPLRNNISDGKERNIISRNKNYEISTTAPFKNITENNIVQATNNIWGDDRYSSDEGYGEMTTELEEEISISQSIPTSSSNNDGNSTLHKVQYDENLPHNDTLSLTENYDHVDITTQSKPTYSDELSNIQPFQEINTTPFIDRDHMFPEPVKEPKYTTILPPSIEDITFDVGPTLIDESIHEYGDIQFSNNVGNRNPVPFNNNSNSFYDNESQEHAHTIKTTDVDKTPSVTTSLLIVGIQSNAQSENYIQEDSHTTISLASLTTENSQDNLGLYEITFSPVDHNSVEPSTDSIYENTDSQSGSSDKNTTLIASNDEANESLDIYPYKSYYANMNLLNDNYNINNNSFIELEVTTSEVSSSEVFSSDFSLVTISSDLYPTYLENESKYAGHTTQSLSIGSDVSHSDDNMQSESYFNVTQASISNEVTQTFTEGFSHEPNANINTTSFNDFDQDEHKNNDIQTVYNVTGVDTTGLREHTTDFSQYEKQEHKVSTLPTKNDEYDDSTNRLGVMKYEYGEVEKASSTKKTETSILNDEYSAFNEKYSLEQDHKTSTSTPNNYVYVESTQPEMDKHNINHIELNNVIKIAEQTTLNEDTIHIHTTTGNHQKYTTEFYGLESQDHEHATNTLPSYNKIFDNATNQQDDIDDNNSESGNIIKLTEPNILNENNTMLHEKVLQEQESSISNLSTIYNVKVLSTSQPEINTNGEIKKDNSNLITDLTIENEESTAIYEKDSQDHEHKTSTLSSNNDVFAINTSQPLVTHDDKYNEPGSFHKPTEPNVIKEDNSEIYVKESQEQDLTISSSSTSNSIFIDVSSQPEVNIHHDDYIGSGNLIKITETTILNYVYHGFYDNVTHKQEQMVSTQSTNNVFVSSSQSTENMYDHADIQSDSYLYVTKTTASVENSTTFYDNHFLEDENSTSFTSLDSESFIDGKKPKNPTDNHDHRQSESYTNVTESTMPTQTDVITTELVLEGSDNTINSTLHNSDHTYDGNTRPQGDYDDIDSQSDNFGNGKVTTAFYEGLIGLNKNGPIGQDFVMNALTTTSKQFPLSTFQPSDVIQSHTDSGSNSYIKFTESTALNKVRTTFSEEESTEHMQPSTLSYTYDNITKQSEDIQSYLNVQGTESTSLDVSTSNSLQNIFSDVTTNFYSTSSSFDNTSSANDSYMTSLDESSVDETPVITPENIALESASTLSYNAYHKHTTETIISSPASNDNNNQQIATSLEEINHNGLTENTATEYTPEVLQVLPKSSENSLGEPSKSPVISYTPTMSPHKHDGDDKVISNPHHTSEDSEEGFVSYLSPVSRHHSQNLPLPSPVPKDFKRSNCVNVHEFILPRHR